MKSVKLTSKEDDALVGNSRALNALFNVVHQNIFKLINTYKSTKAAWDILEMAFEGTSKVKISRLQILTSRFEALQMAKEETIAEFNVRVLDIANESDALGEKMSDSKLVRKVLRRKPGLALTSVKEELIEEHKVSQNNDSLVESMVLLRKQLQNSKVSYTNILEVNAAAVKPTQQFSKEYPVLPHQDYIEGKTMNEEKRTMKSLVATFSDEEDYSESDDNEVRMALISVSTINEQGVKNVNSLASDKQATMLIESINECTLKRNGCSWHMIRNAAFFSELNECNAGSIVFGDEGKGRIIGKGTINHPGLPYLLDVQLVQGLSANLISISQLCDQGYHVSFSKDRCNVIDSQNKVCLSGTRLSDNCYHWDSKVNMCNLSKSEEASLWHKRLGHINGTSIAKAAKVEAIIGLPLTFDSRERCLDCPAGKQVKSLQKPTNQPSTTRTLELLHIDLMGPMQIESMRGKREKSKCKALHIFGSTCFILSDKDHHQKWDSKSNRGIFLGYSTNNRAYRVYNQSSRTVMESINVIIDDHGETSKRSPDEENELF
ncbi:gag-pol polyprotein [Cucumis melo var. makuwa]|uniref:Gag-pol polyprotein n=1 Tax=Cucumis melo var. makuwa TaxID=1194695 RepID=A0A5A7T1D2_CUCMM|nr:gag-pol polyprotein [Cucumis melo var. makuwa]TYK05899.1 gag-pol polyprotein [Cucumis melo var. makuwa]